MNTSTAYLSNDKDLISFQYQSWNIRFRGPYSLEYFASVKQWDHGYLVVMAKYKHNAGLEEEYIDLIPILEDLYIEPNEFLDPIKEVQLGYDEH